MVTTARQAQVGATGRREMPLRCGFIAPPSCSWYGLDGRYNTHGDETRPQSFHQRSPFGRPILPIMLTTVNSSREARAKEVCQATVSAGSTLPPGRRFGPREDPLERLVACGVCRPVPT
jgi:hypothetical protein